MDFALSASDAYLPVEERQREINGFILQSEMSDKRHSVYFNPETKKSHLAVRGTSTKGDLDSLGNLGTDIALMLGFAERTARMAEAERKMNQMKYRYGGDNTVSGHSLGGFITAELVGRHNIEGHAYNPGSTHQDTFKNIACRFSFSQQCKNRRNNLIVHTVEGDPISMGFHYSNGMGMKEHKKYKSKYPSMLGAHKMENFL